MDLVLLGRRDLHQRSFSALKRSLSLSAAPPLFTREREVINSDLKPLDGLSGQRGRGSVHADVRFLTFAAVEIWALREHFQASSKPGREEGRWRGC